MQIKTKQSLLSSLPAMLLAGIVALSAAACGTANVSGAAQSTEAAAPSVPADTSAETSAASTIQESEAPASEAEISGSSQAPVQETSPAPAAPADVPAAKNGEVYILFTSDVHCGVDQGFGYAGLKQIRDTLEEKGYETILVDDGDSIQGDVLGTLTKGEAIIDLMNDMEYDIAIPGNHEFDYGMPKFLELTKKADFPYICCNFTHQGELVFEPWLVREIAGKKIGFAGVLTPTTITTSTPAYFQNEKGENVYGFMQEDKTGEAVYRAVQSAVDAARAEGAELVYLIAHLGNEDTCRPWTYADVIANTEGIDVVLDGHSHDTDQVVMKNKNGEQVTRSAVGTKMNCIGYSHISADGEIVETGIWSWPNKIPAPELLDIRNPMREKVEAAANSLDDELNEVIASSPFTLTINDPEEVDASGRPVRMIRRAETNLGDFCADAYRDQTGADIALINGGAIRVSLEKGDITYRDTISVYPFGNMLCVLEATGQQILDALEWGARGLPAENGGFLQVSGLRYEIRSNISSTAAQDDNGMFAGIQGERRVQNVMVWDEPLDPSATYTVAGTDYVLIQHGDGLTAFDGSPVIKDKIKLDNQALIDYLTDTLGGTVGEEYADPYGQGRITILDEQ
ncbi:MAG: bifunctional metallophosphatase/5'-nucleotidase [Lachnospiraceae bacterium]|nr:bifunctional metallophosphatase/5'-nucleotidase [Lachnospiraceae bacterium]